MRRGKGNVGRNKKLIQLLLRGVKGFIYFYKCTPANTTDLLVGQGDTTEFNVMISIRK